MLRIQNLVKVYPGPVAALQGIDLEVTAGMYGLLGPNGAGKSTLMRILAGLLEPTSGAVSLDDHDVLADPRWLWTRLGYLPQDFGFYPHLTAEAMLVHLLELKGVESKHSTKALARELLERVNLDFAAKRKIKGFSGGMRQRLGIAQAIAGDPRLIIVDEPTAGLDPEERLRFYRLLAELAEDRMVLLSTHIVEDVAILCPRFAIIRNGKLVAETTPAEAKASIEGSVFEGSRERDQLEALQSEHCVTQSIPREGRHRVRIHSPGGLALVGFEPVQPTLEDAYLAIMRREEMRAAPGSGERGEPALAASSEAAQ